jgi:hypothetical protein
MGRRATVSSASRIGRQQRVAEILRLRLEGLTLQAIGERQTPPVSGVAIFQTISKAIAAMTAESLEEVRRIELMRLDRLTETVWPLAASGDVAAIDRVLAVSARRSRLLGLDAVISRAEPDDEARFNLRIIHPPGMTVEWPKASTDAQPPDDAA